MSYNKCPFCGLDFINIQPYSNVANHIRWCDLNPKCIENKKKQKKYQQRFCSLCGVEIKSNRRSRCDNCMHKHTEEMKNHLSQKRIEWLKKNPNKHPWKSKEKFISIPCQNFKKYLDSINLKYVSEYDTYEETNRNFSIDIAFPDIKVGIEINGNQHYNSDGTLRKYYQKRHDIIESCGWKLLEIHYTSCFKEENMKKIITYYEQPNYDEYFIKKRKNKIIKENKIQKIKQQKEDKIEMIKNKILSSNIDFSKYGWVGHVSELTGILSPKVNIFMKKHLKDFYDEKCFKRKISDSI